MGKHRLQLHAYWSRYMGVTKFTYDEVRSYRSRNLKLLPVIPVLTLECAGVEWYGTCMTFARYTLGGAIY